MNKEEYEEALKFVRQLVGKSGVDTSEMTDAEIMAKIKSIWDDIDTGEDLQPKEENGETNA